MIMPSSPHEGFAPSRREAPPMMSNNCAIARRDAPFPHPGKKNRPVAASQRGGVSDLQHRD
jgi:hypothetical protein